MPIRHPSRIEETLTNYKPNTFGAECAFCERQLPTYKWWELFTLGWFKLGNVYVCNSCGKDLVRYEHGCHVLGTKRGVGHTALTFQVLG